jgi:hypothetical protein
MLNHVNRTFGCKVTAGVWVAWSVGWLGRNSVSYIKLCMFIVPLFPALFANGLRADGTSHSRGSAPLLSLLCTQSSRELLYVAHPTVYPRFQSKTHPHVSTLLRNCTRPAFVFHSNFCLLLWTMSYTVRMTLQAKEALRRIYWGNPSSADSENDANVGSVVKDPPLQPAGCCVESLRAASASHTLVSTTSASLPSPPPLPLVASRSRLPRLVVVLSLINLRL